MWMVCTALVGFVGLLLLCVVRERDRHARVVTQRESWRELALAERAAHQAAERLVLGLEAELAATRGLLRRSNLGHLVVKAGSDGSGPN